MRQASGNQGLAQGNTQTGHRRESSSNNHDMNNQGPAATRGGYGGGRGGRGNFNPQYNNQQQQMGYPPANNQYSRNQGAGRGGMGNPMVAPFQNQGRPQFPNSPHQVARSPALTPSMPGTPNMNQAMPNMGPQQYGGYGYPQHMPPQQVHPQNSHYSHEQNSLVNSYKKGGGKGNNKKRLSEKHSNQNSNQNRPRDSRELFGHQIMPDHRSSSEHDSYAQPELRKLQSPPMSSSGLGPAMPNQQNIVPLPEAPRRDMRRSSDDESAAPFLPPIPPPLFADRQFDPKTNDFSPASGNFEEYLTVRQQNYGYPPQQYDPRAMQMQGQYMYPQMNYMGGPPPQSPQPGYQQPQPAYVPGQYAPQPMSRNSSQMSSDPRPASGMGQPQTPSVAPASHPQTPQAKTSSAASPAYTRPVRKSAAIVIKRPDTGDVVDVDHMKVPASPAPSNSARTTPVIASTPTPPPKSSTPQHTRSDSAAPTKTSEQIKAEIAEKVRKAAASDKADNEKLAAETKANEEATKLAEEKEKARLEAEAKEATEKGEAEKKAAEAKAKQDEEDEIERQIAEMEAAEAEREKQEAAMNEKRAAEKAAAKEKAEEERKKNAAEEDRKLKEQEREMERIEDEREAKRAEAEAKAGGDKADAKTQIKNATKGEPTTPTTLASSLSNLTLGTDSGTSTPGSTESMGPPPPKAGPNKKVPAALNLAPLNTKPVEAPQPSAALQSLKSARFLSAINPALYPASINSPNPALNSAVAAKGKSFKYDSAFLMQFQKVFTEKPSMEFESQIKALIGDGDGGSARSASTRGGGAMGSRSNSTRGSAPGSFVMGQFGAVGGKTLPPGTTSVERFAMTNGSMPRPAYQPNGFFQPPRRCFPRWQCHDSYPIKPKHGLQHAKLSSPTE